MADEDRPASALVESMLHKAMGEEVHDLALASHLYDQLRAEHWPRDPSKVYGIRIWYSPNLDPRTHQ